MHYSFLALGDSYTIGEGVPLHQGFPYQAVQMLRTVGVHMHAPEIVAQTGWTTFELKDHLAHTLLNNNYDFVTLLIGVNNQYRGLSVEEYKSEFQFLLNKALDWASKQKHVMVLSIPDWGHTIFAKDRDVNKITAEIDAFNAINKAAADEAGVHYINITPSTRNITAESLTADNLHYSAQVYKIWAKEVAETIKSMLKD